MKIQTGSHDVIKKLSGIIRLALFEGINDLFQRANYPLLSKRLELF